MPLAALLYSLPDINCNTNVIQFVSPCSEGALSADLLEQSKKSSAKSGLHFVRNVQQALVSGHASGAWFAGCPRMTSPRVCTACGCCLQENYFETLLSSTDYLAPSPSSFHPSFHSLRPLLPVTEPLSHFPGACCPTVADSKVSPPVFKTLFQLHQSAERAASLASKQLEEMAQ